MIIDSGVVTGSLQVSGSLTVTGSLTVNGPITGAITGSVTSASYATFAENAGLLNSLVSSSFVGTASFSTFSGSIVTRVGNLESWSSSLDSTFATDASVSASILVLSQSVQASQAALSGSFATTSGSLSTRTTNLESTASTLTTASASFATVSASYATTSASYAAASASLSTRVTTIEGSAATTSSNTFTGTQYISNTTNATGFTSTAALYTDGGLRVAKDAYVSGTAYFNNITVYGTSSVQYSTSSQTDFGTNILTVNTSTPTVRFGGYSVFDSGSIGTGRTGSLLWDSQEDRWIYTTPSGSPEGYASAILISGPPNTGALGSEAGLTTGKIPMGYANDHIVDSIMSATASFVYVTGSLSATTLTGSLNGTNLIAASVANDRLTNSSVTVTAGTGMSGGGAVALGSSVTLTNAGVTSAVAGTAISVSGATGAVTINNTGVTSAVAGTGVDVSGATGAVTISIGQAVATSSNVQFNSLGVGTAGSAVAGEIRATADVTAYYSSDERLKEDITPIENPIEKLMSIDGVTFSWKEGFETIHSHVGSDTGVVAQQIEAIQLPGVVTTRETGYMAVNYEKLNALLIEGFKAQQKEINELKELVNTLLNK